jgi:hypothetical protein
MSGEDPRYIFRQKTITKEGKRKKAKGKKNFSLLFPFALLSNVN